MMEKKDYQVSVNDKGQKIIEKDGRTIIVSAASSSSAFTGLSVIREALFTSIPADPASEALTINGVTGKAIILLTVYFLIAGFAINAYLGHYGLSLNSIGLTDLAVKSIAAVLPNTLADHQKVILLVLGIAIFFAGGFILISLEDRLINNSDTHILQFVSLIGVAIYSFTSVNGFGVLAFVLLPLPAITFLVIAAIYRLHLLRYDQDIALIIISTIISGLLIFLVCDALFFKLQLAKYLFDTDVNRVNSFLNFSQAILLFCLGFSGMFATFLNAIFNVFETDEAAFIHKDIEWQRATVVFFGLIFMVVVIISIAFRRGTRTANPDYDTK